jgi:PilZ domain
MEQLRQFPRFNVHYKVSFSGETGEGEGDVYNLSLGGCAVESQTSVPKGEYLQLRISLPNQATTITVPLGAVRWAIRREFGVEFIRIPHEDQERLRQHLKGLKPVSPTPP